MKLLTSAFLLVIATIISGCNKPPEVLCEQTGFTTEDVCPVTFFHVFGRDDYLGKTVRISGFLRTSTLNGNTRTLLFFSKDQADINGYYGAIEIANFSVSIKPIRHKAYEKVLAQRHESYVEIIGKLRQADVLGFDKVPLVIYDIVGVREVS